jgi:hypothetical protein
VGYWTSNEYSKSHATYCSWAMGIGHSYIALKKAAFRVRAVRVF